MDYVVCFDAGQIGIQWELVGIPAFILMVGTLLLAANVEEHAKLRPVLRVYVVMAALATVGSFVHAYSAHRSAAEALRQGRYAVVEGIVSNFHKMPPGGHSIESFEVGGKRFEYGAGWGSITFNSERNKGCIEQGMQARISYNDLGILRVEVSLRRR